MFPLVALIIKEYEEQSKDMFKDLDKLFLAGQYHFKHHSLLIFVLLELGPRLFLIIF